MASNTGGPAFPQHISEMQRLANNNANNPVPAGMTLRDYFAAKAVQAFLSAAAYQHSWTPETLAKDAYTVADAMLEARNLQ